MPDPYINKELIDRWVIETFALVKRNVSDIKDHDEDIESIRAMIRKEVGKLYDRVSNDCKVLRQELHDLETRIEKEISELRTEARVDLAQLKAKMTLWGMLGGLVAAAIVSAIVTAIAGKL